MGDLKISVNIAPTFAKLIIAWLTLFVLYLILKKLLYKPVSNILVERQKKIQSEIDESKALKSEAEQLKLQYEAHMESAKEEAQEIIEAARQRGEELRLDIVSKAQKEAQEIKSRAKVEISREREAAFQEVKSQTGDLALLIASKIMEEEINSEKQNQLIEKFIDEVGSSKWQN
ncbi:F0F1 ATP synthase subunit B [Wansuia hejianensis]|uniref:ATP synthase subunit b n=1 Tax=Wansuia hejianensis TaxID=2763667 RepID=A0A926IMW7_9FIRM|nr:F0F1 ATP synthase subunit B [Wansuia hejianensis]MBC8590083.1 F0F1 ATP synthase subunit B [Wansuia hejianensis]